MNCKYQNSYRPRRHIHLRWVRFTSTVLIGLPFLMSMIVLRSLQRRTYVSLVANLPEIERCKQKYYQLFRPYSPAPSAVPSSSPRPVIYLSEVKMAVCAPIIRTPPLALSRSGQKRLHRGPLGLRSHGSRLGGCQRSRGTGKLDGISQGPGRDVNDAGGGIAGKSVGLRHEASNKRIPGANRVDGLHVEPVHRASGLRVSLAERKRGALGTASNEHTPGPPVEEPKNLLGPVHALLGWDAEQELDLAVGNLHHICAVPNERQNSRPSVLLAAVFPEHGTPVDVGHDCCPDVVGLLDDLSQ
mmetsp:Transcript_6337/g.19144  ORF Transcript_6337/g.19144 Transcript_6337/m.19144 type:complete len:300 (-) Transcript_6337:634-1533(-)